MRSQRRAKEEGREKRQREKGWKTKGERLRESTRTIIRSRAGSSKDPRDDISMPCLRNNFNYPRYTKKNTKSNARNSGERTLSSLLLRCLPLVPPFSLLPSHSPLKTLDAPLLLLCRYLSISLCLPVATFLLDWLRCQWTTMDSVLGPRKHSLVHTRVYVRVRSGIREREDLPTYRRRIN